MMQSHTASTADFSTPGVAILCGSRFNAWSALDDASRQRPAFFREPATVGVSQNRSAQDIEAREHETERWDGLS